MTDLAAQVLSRFDLAVAAYAEGELDFMVDTVAEVRPAAIFEWGTGSGASGRIFHETVHILGHPCVIHTTELPDECSPLEDQHPREKVGMYLPKHGVAQHVGDGVVESLKAWSRMDGPPNTLWFLDGDHNAHSVYREIALIDRMVPDAVMLIHDTRSGPGAGAEWWVSDQGKNRFTSIEGRTGVGRLDPL